MMSESPHTAGAVPQSTPAPESAAGSGAGTEEYKARWVWIRAAFYIAGTHLFGAFIWLLFTVAE